MRVAYITAGAAGMYCGSCIHDNALAAALSRRNADVVLIPTYTPLRTDEENVALDRVFYGGVSIFLQQQWSFFRRTHRLFDRVLDSPFLIRTLARFGSSTNARTLGPLTVSILAGEEGNQQKELTRLIAWLQRDFKPDLIQLTNAMFVGMARQLKAQLGVPVLCALQGEDLFLDGLVDPYKSQALKTLRQRAQDIDAFIAPCAYYQEHMAEYLQVPRTKIHVVPLGLNLTGHGQEPPPTDGPYKIGYLARICPEKGFHLLVDAFQQLKEQPEFASLRLEAAGYLSAYDKPYFAEQMQKIRRWGTSRFVHLPRRSRSPRKNPLPLLPPRLFRTLGLRRSQRSVYPRSPSQRHPSHPARPRRIPRADRSHRRRSPRHTPFPRGPSQRACRLAARRKAATPTRTNRQRGGPPSLPRRRHGRGDARRVRTVSVERDRQQL